MNKKFLLTIPILGMLLTTACSPVAFEVKPDATMSEMSQNENVSPDTLDNISKEISIDPANIELTATSKPLTAYQAASKLKVNNKLPSGYKRNMFGASWIDTNRNNCDTRNDILAIQLGNVKKSGKCKVVSGTVYDPYTLKSKGFKAGAGNNVDIDHVVALSDGYKSGANKFNAGKKAIFANDPLNLLAVDAGLNRYKGDKSAATWLPSHGKKKSSSINAKLDCPYVARQVAVKKKYNLSITSAERNKMLAVLSKCKTEKMPTTTPKAAELAKKMTGKAPVTPTKPTTPTKPKPSTGKTDPNMGTCAAAKKAGYGPYKKGVHAEYNFYRDGDKDGWVCE